MVFQCLIKRDRRPARTGSRRDILLTEGAASPGPPTMRDVRLRSFAGGNPAAAGLTR